MNGIDTTAGKYNTYVGMRYVPLIEGEWDSTKAYEPLTIVTYQGDSYTSKTFVPAGIPVTNTTYWVLTGNYSAQIAAITEDVNQLKNEMGKVIQGYTTWYNVVELGLVNDGTSTVDNAALMNQWFNDDAYNQAVFYFPNGTYAINKTVTVENGATLLLDPHAEIMAVATMDVMFQFNNINHASASVTSYDYINKHRFIDGGIFNANNMATICIAMKQCFNVEIANATFHRFTTGVDLTYGASTSDENAECLMNNLRFQQDLSRITASVGIKVQRDMVITNCFFLNVSSPIIMTGGGNFVSKVHAWLSQDALMDLGAFFTMYNTNSISDVYCDSFKYLTKSWNSGEFICNMSNIFYLSQGAMGTDYILDSTGYYNISNYLLTAQSSTMMQIEDFSHVLNLNGFYSAYDTCLFANPIVSNVLLQPYTTGKPITTLEGISAGIYYGSKVLGGPTTTSTDYTWYDVRKISANDFFIVAYITADTATENGIAFKIGNFASGSWNYIARTSSLPNRTAET